MQAIKATWIDGQIVPDGPVDWPNALRLTIDPEPTGSFAGMSEECQGDDPESIARWIAAFDSIPPLVMTPEEEAAWQAARNAQREFEKSNFDQHAQKLRDICE